MKDIVEDFDLPPLGVVEDPLDVRGGQLKGDDRLDVSFYTNAVHDVYQSTQKGVPTFVECDYIVIKVPGSTLTTIDAPVKEYLPRFVEKYRAWKTKADAAITGNPIESLPHLKGKVAMLASLRAMNINTVEQLADLPDNYLQRIMGGYELKNRAVEWLGNNAPVDSRVAEAISDSTKLLQNENADLKARLDEMEKVIAQLSKTKRGTKAEPTQSPVVEGHAAEEPSQPSFLAQ